MRQYLACFFLALLWNAAIHAAGPTYTDPAMTDADFPYQGEYVGMLKAEAGEQKVGLQVIALGKGKFHLVEYHGGLPGAGWKKGESKHEMDGELKDGVVTTIGARADVRIKDGVATTFARMGPKQDNSRKSSGPVPHSVQAHRRRGCSVRWQVGRSLRQGANDRRWAANARLL